MWCSCLHAIHDITHPHKLMCRLLKYCLSVMYSKGPYYNREALYLLLKALPPVCMKYTARGKSRVANIARGEGECCICHETLTKSCICQ